MKIAQTILLAPLLMAQSMLANASDSILEQVVTCREAYQGAPVIDGHKQLTLKSMGISQYLLTVTQKDRFNGDKALLQSVSVVEERCGFTPCRSFQSATPQVNFYFLVSGSEWAHGQLNSDATGVVELLCKRE